MANTLDNVLDSQVAMLQIEVQLLYILMLYTSVVLKTVLSLGSES